MAGEREDGEKKGLSTKACLANSLVKYGLSSKLSRHQGWSCKLSCQPGLVWQALLSNMACQANSLVTRAASSQHETGEGSKRRGREGEGGGEGAVDVHV